jgi:hypothetical protein
MRQLQISSVTSCYNTLVPLYDDELRYCAIDRVTLNHLSVTNLSRIDSLPVQELRQILP